MEHSPYWESNSCLAC